MKKKIQAILLLICLTLLASCDKNIEVEEVIIQEPIENEIVIEETIENEIVIEEPIEDEIVIEEPIEDEIVIEEPIEDEIVIEEPIEDEIVIEEPIEDEIVIEEPIEEEIVIEEPIEEEIVIEEPIEEEIVIEEPVEEEIITPEIVEPTDTSSYDVNGLPNGSLSDWNLILLNHGAENKIDAELNFTKVKFDTQYVDSRAGEYYQLMCNDALKEGITLYLRSGYRSMSTQTVNYNANVQRLQNTGLSYDEAVKQTNLYYTVPGHSEHHTGLAFDIITPQYHNDVYTLGEKFAETTAYAWLKENCVNYGFIERYTADKTGITQINWEPWHYRYVGVEHAKYITENGLCFEEYVQILKENGR